MAQGEGGCGRFDRSARGLVIGPVSVRVERGGVRRFSQVLGTADPVHADVSVARARGFPDLVAPPSFFTVIDAAANDELERNGQPAILDRIGCDYRRLLHGGEHYDFMGPIFAGDDVLLTTTVLDFYDRKGGALEFVTLGSTVAHADRGLLLRATRTLLHRLH